MPCGLTVSAQDRGPCLQCHHQYQAIPAKGSSGYKPIQSGPKNIKLFYIFNSDENQLFYAWRDKKNDTCVHKYARYGTTSRSRVT